MFQGSDGVPKDFEVLHQGASSAIRALFKEGGYAASPAVPDRECLCKVCPALSAGDFMSPPKKALGGQVAASSPLLSPHLPFEGDTFKHLMRSCGSFETWAGPY